jgi:hypothetical protein
MRAGMVVFFILLLTIGKALSQDQGLEKLQQQFNGYQSTHLQEKLFVHTDKTFYLAGEIIWFKVYAVDAFIHQPLDISRIAYIEILNAEGRPVVQTKISMDHGDGNGSLIIPVSLGSANYIFRAYTSWMKNFAPDFYFERTLHIVNTFRPAISKEPVKSLPVIRFFPEGGRAVADLQGRMAFKATTPDGRGVDCEGLILNQNNDTLLHFQSLMNGMGSFLLKPEKNKSYYALVRLQDSLIKQKLPDAAESGYTLQVTGDASDSVNILVQASEGFDNTRIYLLTHTRQIIKNAQTGMLKGGRCFFYLNKKELGDGISVITLFDESKQPVCERLIFKRPMDVKDIQVRTDQTEYGIRKPVKVGLTNPGAVTIRGNDNYSVSVFMLDSLQHMPEQNIVNYLYLSSELKGAVQGPEYYFSHHDQMADQALDNLLLTQGWRRFAWKDVFDSRKPFFEFLPEMEGSVVNMKITNRSASLPIGHIDSYLSIPGNEFAFNSATSDELGITHFGFRDIYKNNALVVQPVSQKDSNYRIDVTNSYSDKISERPVTVQELSKSMQEALLSRSIGNQVENTYNLEKKHRYAQLNLDTLSFYGVPDRLYNLEEYTRFQTMEEVLREYVEDVRVRKDGEKYYFKVRNGLFKTYFEEDPLILVDGIPVTDASRIIALDPLKFKKIEVVTHNYYVGSSAFAGIINVKSYTGESGATQIDPNALVVEYTGLQQQREFYSPAYATADEQESHIPDFRNVLYWSPHFHPVTDGNPALLFYTSDIKGRFALMVQGISSDGVPVKTFTLFDVKDKK